MGSENTRACPECGDRGDGPSAKDAADLAYVEYAREYISGDKRREARYLDDKRDYFAASVLNGWLAAAADNDLREMTGEAARVVMTLSAYEWADAMMAARGPKP